jgi:uncharacterized membrane protein
MMTSSGGEQQRGGGLLSTLANNPAVRDLGSAARDYARARGGDAAKKVGQRLNGMTDSLNDTADGGGFKPTAVGEAAKRVTSGDSPVKAALGGAGTAIKEKVGELFGRSKSGGAGGNKKVVSIIEDITVGVPVDVAYDQWTQFQEFASFMKGVDSVEQADDVTTNWRAKVFKSRRSWKASVTEQIPDRRIAWTSQGAKGSTKGVVTFHPLADDLTQVLLVIEYYPQGLFEKTGNIWKAQGRRARLDLKNFRRFIMMRGEATGSWRGEVRDGEVVRGPDEEDETSEDRAEGQSQDDEGQDEEDQEDEDQARGQSDEDEDDEGEEGDEPNIAEDRSADADQDDADQDEARDQARGRRRGRDREQDGDRGQGRRRRRTEGSEDGQGEQPARRRRRETAGAR